MATPELSRATPVVLGHYRILKKIGAGGMGEVFLAHDERLDRDVAIKLLPSSRVADEAARARFRSEALSLSKLNHANIATIHDFDTDQSRDFLVMEYIAGTTLSDRILAGPIPEAEVAQIGVQIAEGLAAAHEQGVIHRDIKPGNVRISADGHVKILDFGLAKLVRPSESADSTQSLSVGQAAAGTLPYMAPEQLRGQACDPRTDIYSVGAVLYEMATGQRVYGKTESAELIDAIFHTQPPPARTCNPKLSLAFEALVGKALEKNPARRQQGARELLGELRALASLSGSATVMPVLPWIKWRLRRQYRAVLACSVLALAAVMAIVWFAGRTPAMAFTAGDYVLLSDFDNQTGDPVFDKSLSTAFATSLGQSAYANLYSRRRVYDVLKRMKKPATDHLDEAVAQEIAVREGLKAIIVPSISGVGENYRIAATIRDSASGKDIKTEVVKASGKKKVLDAVDALASAVRKDLGESLQSIEKSKPLVSVTTQSLEALRQYSIATGKAITLQWDEARIYFENALRIDPGFTAARASLGIMHVEQSAIGRPHFDSAYGKKLLGEAVQHVDGLTDREKYGILAFHARAVENNPEKAVAEFKTLQALYPNESTTHVNLGRAYEQMRRMPEAVREYEEAIRLEPGLVLAYGNLAAAYLYQMGDVRAAMPVCRDLLKFDPENAWAFDCIGLSHFARGELQPSQAAYEKAVALNPQFTLARFRLAYVHRLQKHFPQALEALQPIEKIDPSDASALYEQGVTYGEMGDEKKARDFFERYRTTVETQWKKSIREPGIQLALAAVDARLGETTRARQKLRAVVASTPELHRSAAAVLSLVGDKKAAVEQLSLAIRGGYTNYIWLKMDTDFQPLHGLPDFEQLLASKIKL